MARQTGVTVDVAKSELAGYGLFSGANQTTPKVMGSGAGVKTSATYETLVNTAKVLNSIGRIQRCRRTSRPMSLRNIRNRWLIESLH